MTSQYQFLSTINKIKMRDQENAIHLQIGNTNKKIKWITLALLIVLLLAIGAACWAYSRHRQTIAELRSQLVLSQRECRSNLTLLLYQQQQSKKQLQEYFGGQQSKISLLLQQLANMKKHLAQLANGQQEKWQESKRQTAALLQKDEELASSQKRMEDDHTKQVKRIDGQLLRQQARLANGQQNKQDENRIQTATLLQRNEELASSLKRMEDDHTKQVKRLAAQLLRIDDIGHHPDNSHKYFYILTPTSATSARLLKTGSNGWHNFVNKFAIFPQIGEIKYKVKIWKTWDNGQAIGFTTEKGFGDIKNYGSSEAVYYQGQHNGRLWEQGQRKQLSASPVRADDTVEVSVNFVTGKFEWLKEGTKLAECSIPASMKAKPIYLSILIFYPNYEVEVFA